MVLQLNYVLKKMFLVSLFLETTPGLIAVKFAYKMAFNAFLMVN